MTTYHRWTTAQLRYVKDNLDKTDREMAEHLGLTRLQVHSFRRRQGWIKPDEFKMQFLDIINKKNNTKTII